MNREVEERIVAMHFDNKDFEKNAQTTIETLGQLREGLNLEESSKGFQVFEKIGKTLNFDKANQSLQTMRGRLTSMGGMLGKVFKIGNGPIREAEGLISNIRGMMGKVIGIDLADAVWNSMKGAFRQLTVAPVSAGWNQYESTMDSIKTIMSSTNEDLATVEKHLAGMTEYANKTIYSLTDMTSNLGKFTNNGVELERATKAMEGIANATADAGQGAQQASMAMYNISQAIGVGKMTTIDWKSLENANIATQKLKNTFLEMAAASGKVKKEITKDANGQSIVSYWLEQDEDGKKLKQRIQLTTANFREYLSKGWLDKETMLRTFEVYSGATIDENTFKSWGITDPEQIKNLMKLGQEALEAATQVRTFSKMMDALKESVQSGWADTFKIIFGNMEEGTQLWTRLNEKLDGILSKTTERRNKLLSQWAEMTEGGKYWKKDEHGNDVRTGVEGGRDILQNAFFSLIEIAQTLGETVSTAFTNIFGKLDAKKLFDLTIGFRNLMNNIKVWLNTTQNGTTRLQKLQKGLQGIFSIVKVGINFIKIVINLAKRLFGPILDWAVTAFEAVGKFFDGLGDMRPAYLFKALGRRLKDVWKDITNFFKKENGQESPFETWAKNAWNGFKGVIKDWLKDIGLEGVWNTVSGWWHTIKQAFIDGWNTVSTWWSTSGIPEFFEGIWNAVVGWFTPKTITGKQGNTWTENAPIVQFFIDIWEGMQAAYEDLSEWWNGSGIPEFFEGIWNAVVGWFTPKTITGKMGNSWQENAPVVQFFLDIWDGIQSAYSGLSEWWNGSGIPEFFEGIWESVVGWFTPKTITGKQGNTWTENAPIVQFFLDIWDGIQSAYSGLSKWWSTSGIPEFFEGIWESVVGWFTPKTITGKMGNSWTEDSPIVTFFKGVWEGIKDVYDTLKEWWESDEVQGVLQEIGEFFTQAWNWILSLFGEETETASPQNQSGRLANRMRAFGGAISDVGWTAKEITKDTPDSSTGMEQKTSVFKTIIDTITSFITKIVDAIRGWVIPPEVDKFLQAAGTLLKGIIDQVTILMQSLGNILQGKGSLTDFTNFIGLLLPIIIIKIAEIFNNKNLAHISAGQNFAQKFLEIAGGLFLLATAVALLSTLNQANMWSAVGAMIALGAVIGVIVGLTAKLNESRTSIELTGGQQIINNIVNQVGKIGMLAVAMALLPGVIKSIGEVKKDLNGADVGRDVLDVLLGLSAIIATTSVIFAAVQKMTGGTGLSIAATVKTCISLMLGLGVILALFAASGGVLELIDGVVDKIAGNDVDTIGAIRGGMEKVASLIEGVGKALGGFFKGIASAFGYKTPDEQMKDGKDTLLELSEFSEVLDSEKITGISRIMSLMITLSKDASKLDSGKMSGVAAGIREITNGIFYLNQLSTGTAEFGALGDPDSTSYKRLQGHIDIVHKLTEAFGQLRGVDRSNLTGMRDFVIAMSEDEKLLASFIDGIRKIMSGLGSIEGNDGIQFDGLAIAGKLYKSIGDGLKDPNMPAFDATSIVDDIVEAIGIGESTIALAVHNMVQQGMNLSHKDENGEGYNLDQTTKELLNGLINASGDVNGSTMLANVNEQLYGKDGKSGLLGAITDFEKKMPDLGSVFKDKGWMDFKDENGNDIDILGQIQSHLTELGSTLSEMDPLTIKITPVFNWNDFEPESIQGELDNKTIAIPINPDSGKIMIDFAGLNNALDFSPITQKLDTLADTIRVYVGNTTTAVSNLGSHMDSISYEISRMKLILDTGLLVGAITPMVDEQLYRNSLVTDRTGGTLSVFSV